LRYLPVCGYPALQHVPTPPICTGDAIEIT
jgi:hypothetical protein